MISSLDLQFSTQPQPVLVHPLLQTSQRNFTFVKNNVDAEKPEMDKSGAEQEFLDPLGAASTTAKIGTYNTPTKANGDTFRQSKIFTAAITGPLDNTLAGLDEDEQMEWPISGLDRTEQQLVGFRPWNEIRIRILAQFTTNDNLTLESSFLMKPEKLAENGANGSIGGNRRQQQLQQRQRITAAVKEKKRLGTGKASTEDQLVTKFYDLSQEEWCRKMVELRKHLLLKWRQQNRLECIKLIAELLVQLSGNICSAQFYPAQFVHITDLLDLFGWLVWQRLSQMAQEERRKAGLGQLPSQWTINDVLGETRLKARNWFGKINQTVNMLAPKIYMIAAILPCQRFMDPWPSAAQENALELCRAAQQIQHPLISSYLRSYLCRTAMRIQPADRAPHWKCLNDWLQTFTQQPISLLWPAMEWVIQCVAYTSVAYEDLHPLWEYCKRMDKRPIVLVPMLNSLPRLYLGEHALEACRIVTGSELVTGEELCALGRNLLEAEIPHQALKPILRSAWKCILRLGSLKEYLACCDCWCEFVVRHFTVNEVQVVLENMLRKLQYDKYEHYHLQLLSILSKIFLKSNKVGSLLGMEIFSKIFDIFRSAPSTIRVQACQVILGALVEKHQFGAFSDVSIAYQVLSVCKLLHDSLELSAPTAHISDAIHQICSALDRVDLHANPDQCLAFLVSCRADLSSWDALQRHVIRRVQAFTLHIVRSIRYTSSRAAFLQGCLANLFISIPSLADPFERIQLAIQSAQIALAAFAFLRVDSFIEFALDQFVDLPTGTMAESSRPLLQIGSFFLATLLAFPQTAEMVDDDDEEGAERKQQQHPLLRHFRPFLHKILGFQLSSSSPASLPSAAAQLDRLRLLIRCLQFIFLRQSNISCPFPPSSNLLFGNPIVADFSLTAFPVGQIGWPMDQQELEDEEGGRGTLLMEECAELCQLIAEAIEPDLLDANASEATCSAGMELLELINQFGGDQLPSHLRTLAKAAYKKYRRKPALSARINRLKGANS